MSARYAELQTTSNFSFLKGASHPQELVLTAAALGQAAVGICDRNTLAGVVRGHTEAKAQRFRLLVGARLDFADGTPSLLCYPTDREAFGRLTRLLSLGKLRAEKGDCILNWEDFLAHAEGQVALMVPPAELDAGFEAALARTSDELRRSLYLAGSRPYGARDNRRLDKLAALAASNRVPLVATNDVLYHDPRRRPLQDVLSCVREKCTIEQAGFRLEANAERHLKSPDEMARLFRRWPGAVERTLEIVERCPFRLDELRYEYPHEPVPPGKTAMEHLADLSWAGALWRYGGRIPKTVEATIRKELALIAELNYPHYFLTVLDVVRFARDRGILCQGRGSAANSAVCYCLGITAVNPVEHGLLFERFLSKERSEPPDIDVDFEHERREEVIQYVYERYGRERAAICATVIHYRPRMAIREVGKALGLTEDVTAALADTVWGSWGSSMPDEHVKQAGLDPANPEIRRAVDLAEELLGFPRHLSQHVGGFILTERRLDETVPIGNAAMKDRTFIEWDKDDIDALGLMKVDVLALGMLTCLKRGFEMLGAKGVKVAGKPVRDIADIPAEDASVYDMLSRADSVGVFQVESRAQMSMLPRLKPRTFYDLVIEVAIVRPGPIQGDMVHPYLRRRDGIDPVEFPSPAPEHGPADELAQVLGRTLGVPLFQEQAMKLAIEAAKFTPDEANGLRRAMATFKHQGDVGVYRTKFVEGMVSRGYARDFAERCFKQIEGFGSYGFPESHAASFAKLVYASAWIKKHHPDVFCAAILNSQPMGFYQPAQLVRDAREHGVEVRGPDVSHSAWDCSLEPPGRPKDRYRAVRLGLRQVRGLAQDEGERLVAARAFDPGASFETLTRTARLSRRSIELLAEADAFRSVGMDRRAALWLVKGMQTTRQPSDAPLLALMGEASERAPELPAMPLPEHVIEDYRTTSLSLKAHPVAFFRESLTRRKVLPAIELKRSRAGRRVTVAGLALIRQRPGTAKGVCFMTLEDETGPANIIVWPDRFEANRKVVMTASFLLVEGKVERQGEVIHVVADRFVDLSAQLGKLRDGSGETAMPKSRDFH